MAQPVKVTVNTIRDIASEKRFLIDELTIVGRFELRPDLPILRSMCNTLVDGKRTGGNLSVVDLSHSDIASEFGTYCVNPNSWGDMKDCISLKKILFPSLIHINADGGRYFSGCKSLQSISVVGSSYPEYDRYGRTCDVDGVLFYEKRDRYTLVKFPANHGNEYVVPSRVAEIADYAFEDCHLTRLTMPIVPPSCTGFAFFGVNMVALTLVVPKGAHDSYWAHPVLGKFNIEEMVE